jgi:hypothetical protein
MARFTTDPESTTQERTAAQPETEVPGEDLQHQQGPPAPDHQNPKPTVSEASVPARREANGPAPSATGAQEACPEPSEAATGSAPRQPKPKRKYTVSERSKASSRANLGQARKAPYIFTPAREAASMKALEKANAAPPEKRNRFTMLRLLRLFGVRHRWEKPAVQFHAAESAPDVPAGAGGRESALGVAGAGGAGAVGVWLRPGDDGPGGGFNAEQSQALLIAKDMLGSVFGTNPISRPAA